MAWTALAIWFEPMRHLFELGQIGALLMIAVLFAVYSSRWWVSGLLVGLATGMKLTPAVAGLYFVGARRWGVVRVLRGGVRRDGGVVDLRWAALRPGSTSPTCWATPTGSAWWTPR